MFYNIFRLSIIFVSGNDSALIEVKILPKNGLCEVKVGPVVAEISQQNYNTGASISSTHIGGSFLGFGASIGSDTHAATPFGKIGFKF